jgi:hypothetical protein
VTLLMTGTTAVATTKFKLAPATESDAAVLAARPAPETPPLSLALPVSVP